MSKFSLPGSSFEEVKKIVRAYGSAKPDASLADIGALSGLHATVVSRNNKFISEIGLVQGGKKKAITDLGKKLSRAIDHEQIEEQINCWAEALKTNEALSGVLTTVRIKGGMSEADLTKHILYVSEQANNSGNKTGARCLQDIFVSAHLLDEKDGKFSVARPMLNSTDGPLSSAIVTPTPSEVVETPVTPSKVENTRRIENIPVVNSPTVSINVQLHLPEAKDPETYERIFKALRDNLLNG